MTMLCFKDLCVCDDVVFESRVCVCKCKSCA